MELSSEITASCLQKSTQFEEKFTMDQNNAVEDGEVEDYENPKKQVIINSDDEDELDEDELDDSENFSNEEELRNTKRKGVNGAQLVDISDINMSID